MGVKELIERTARRKAQGANQRYPQHAAQGAGSAPAPPGAVLAVPRGGRRELRVRLEVLREACPHLGPALPKAAACGPALHPCAFHLGLVTRAGACADAKASCESCGEHPARKRAAAPRAFPPVATRHLLYHVYPRIGSRWRERLLRLRERIELFNGVKVVAVALDRTTDGANLVEEALAGTGCELIPLPNDPNLREVATFLPLFERVSGFTDPTHAVLYAHAKGATKPRHPTAHRWVETLEECLLGDWDRVDAVLRSHPAAGCFLKTGRAWPDHESRAQWHYSGSWYWLRTAELFGQNDWRRIDRTWTGIEPYPAHHFDLHEAGCVFMGPLPAREMDLYREEYWHGVVEPALARWRAHA
jgi:hypothetical protein